jgi:hypothetical protein
VGARGGGGAGRMRSVDEEEEVRVQRGSSVEKSLFIIFKQ